MMRVFLLGNPLGHSLSPVMHNAAFRALGLDWRYELLETPLEGLPEAFETLRRDDVAGANVTIPHKQSVIQFIDDLANGAGRIGAVNTIVKREGRLVGENTDLYGIIRVLQDEGVNLIGARVTVLGAGGAARALVFALAQQHVASIVIFNRTVQRAQALASDLRHLDAALDVSINAPSRLKEASLIVNATSVGMSPKSDETPMPSGTEFPPGAVAFDLVYRPLKTRFLTDAERSGLKTIDGLSLLVHQGAAAFKMWTGLDAPVQVMFDAVRTAIHDK